MAVVVVYARIIRDVIVQDCNEEYCKRYQVLVKILTEDVKNSKQVKLYWVPMIC